MKFYIRNDIDFIYKNFSHDEKLKILKELEFIFHKYYYDFDIDVIDAKIQLDKAQRRLKDKNTLSLDCWFRGKHNIRTSRLFKYNDAHERPYDIVFDNINIEDKKDLIIVDDDISTGFTIRKICEYYNIQNYSIYTLLNSTEKYDVVDVRDYIFGAEFGGLLINKNNKYYRLPYISNYINLKNRASLNFNAKEFSNEIIDLNMEIFKNNNIEHTDILKVEKVKNIAQWYKKIKSK